MTDFQLHPTHNPCPWCKIAPCVDCRDAKTDSFGIMPDGIPCAQGYRIWEERRNAALAGQFVGEHTEFNMPQRFKNSVLADCLNNTAKYPDRAWQAKWHGRLSEWVRATMEKWEGVPLNVAIVGGKSGIGKSYIAAGMVNELRNAGVSAVFVEMKNLLGMINQAQFARREDNGLSVSEIMEVVQGCEVLALDDVTATHVTEYQRDLLWTVVDKRYSEMRPTIFTTQRPEDEMSRSVDWERIGRRLYQGALVISVDAKPPRPEQPRRDIN